MNNLPQIVRVHTDEEVLLQNINILEGAIDEPMDWADYLDDLSSNKEDLLRALKVAANTMKKGSAPDAA